MIPNFYKSSHGCPTGEILVWTIQWRNESQAGTQFPPWIFYPYFVSLPIISHMPTKKENSPATVLKQSVYNAFRLVNRSISAYTVYLPITLRRNGNIICMLWKSLPSSKPHRLLCTSSPLSYDDALLFKKSTRSLETQLFCSRSCKDELNSHFQELFIPVIFLGCLVLELALSPNNWMTNLTIDTTWEN